MKIVLVLALVLGVALFPHPSAATTDSPDVKCYRCGDDQWISGYGVLKCDKLEKKDDHKIKCPSGICYIGLDTQGKLKESGCYYGTSTNVTESIKQGKCLMKHGVNNCYSPDFTGKNCEEKSRKRRDETAADATVTEANPPGGDAAPPSSGSAGEPADANKGASAAGSGAGSNSDAPKARSLADFQKTLGPFGYHCLCEGDSCNWELKPKHHKCYVCNEEAAEGKEGACINLDTEKAETVECPGTHCGIWKWKVPASADAKSPAMLGIIRGCAPVSQIVYDCFKKHGDEVDKATCAIGSPSKSVTSYGKVDKCLGESKAEGRQSSYIKFTSDQEVEKEFINCICEGELCNESGKGSHLVLSNGVVMLGLMMMIARTGKLI